MKKLLIRIALMVILILIGLGVILGISLDRVVRNSILTVGPEITKVNVRLGDVKLSLFSGSGELKGLVVGNPDGFLAPSAMDLGQAKLVLQPSSMLSDKVVIHSIELTEPVITLEGPLRSTNLGEILKNIEESTGPADQPKKPAGESKKLQVDKFVLRGAKLNLRVPLLRGLPPTVSLPDIELRNLGQGPEGITAAELTRLALQAVLEKATALVSSHLNVGGQGTKQAIESGQKAADKALDLLKKKP